MSRASLWPGLIAGALCAIAIACGGAGKSPMAPSPTVAPGSDMPGAGVVGGARSEIDELSRKIDADLATLGLEQPAVPLDACIKPPCQADALSTVRPAAHTAEPSCRPGPAEICRDSCKLSDSICDSSGRICRIATDLGGGDAYANEKCASGKASCESSRTKCCGCQ